MCNKQDLKVARKLNSLYQSAAIRGIHVDLPFQSLKNVFNAKKCFYTGVELNDTPNHPHQRTIDRVDNTQGYVKGNIVACTKEFNERKGGLTKDDLRILARKIL